MPIKKVQAIKRFDPRAVGGAGRRAAGNHHAAGKAQYNPSLKLAIDIARVVEAPIEEIFVFK